MAEINILLIEDLETEIQSFKNSATRLGEENGVEFKLKNYTNLSSALYQDILENKYDFIIVDLKLSDGGFGGNDFLKIAKRNLHIPIIINSADLTKLDSEFNMQNNPLINQFNVNNTTTDDILNYILNIYKTGLTKVLGSNGEIETTLNNLIWDGGLNNINEWSKFGNENLSKKSLSRYILSHLHHNLSGDYDDFHSEEIYLKAMGTNKFDTGAIIKNISSGEFFIILTPACDIANCNTDYYLVAKINDISINIDIEKLKSNLEIINTPTSQQNLIDKAKKSINSIIREMKSDDSKRNKLLPESSLFKGGYINFEKLEKINNQDKSNYELVCYISSHFLKDIISDFGYYYSRQGQPNLNNDIIIKNLLNNSDNV